MTSFPRAALAAAVALTCSTSLFAAGPDAASDPSDMAAQLQALKAQVSAMAARDEALKAQVADLQRQQTDNWLTQERTNQIKAIVQEVLDDAKTRGQFADGPDFGYHDGFYIQSADQAFTFRVNGLVDFRYTYSHAENNSHISGTPLDGSRDGDMSGFGLNLGEIIFSGSLYHNVLYRLMGNFGAFSSPTSPNAGTFQLAEYWIAYSLSPEVNFRGGSLVTPIIPLRALTISGGLQFPDIATATLPFGAGFSLGADVYGTVQDRFSYDVMLSDGSASSNEVDSAIPGGGRDNRLGFYTREQFAGSGTIADFADEPDTQNHQNFVWILAAGGGYESRASGIDAFPSPQTSTTITGLSTGTSPGFVNGKYTLDGNLYRAAADFRAKYRGFSFFSEVLYQRINADNNISPLLARTDVGQLGYFLQGGYFLIPKKLDLAARFAQLYTTGEPNHMDEYTVGLDYYMFGENAKLQFAETFIPTEAALTNSTGSIVNTQDLVTELQFQVKF